MNFWLVKKEIILVLKKDNKKSKRNNPRAHCQRLWSEDDDPEDEGPEDDGLEDEGPEDDGPEDGGTGPTHG